MIIIKKKSNHQMKGNPSQASRKEESETQERAPRTTRFSSTATKKVRDNNHQVTNNINPHDHQENTGEDTIQCSGQHCKSCIAGAIADCVAVCCCPCFLLNFLALAFVKVPYTMGKKCLGKGKMKGQKKRSEKLRCKNNYKDCVIDREENCRERIRKSEEGNCGEGGDCERNNRMELPEAMIHLGFGRVSFTGVHIQGKGD